MKPLGKLKLKRAPVTYVAVDGVYLGSFKSPLCGVIDLYDQFGSEEMVPPAWPLRIDEPNWEKTFDIG